MFSQKTILKEVVDHSVNGIIITDRSGTIKSYNQWFTNTLGWEPGVKIGENLNILSPVSFLHPPEMEIPFSFPGFFDICKPIRAEFVLNDAEGQPLPVQLAIRELEDGDNTLFLCFLLNMTEHFLLEEKKENQDRELSKLTANIPGIVFRCNYERNRPIQFIDATIEKLSGLSQNDFLTGKAQYTQLMHPSDEQRIWHEIGLSLQRGDSYTVEYRLLHQSGTTTWVSENGRVVVDEQGMPRSIVGVITDNTLTKTINAEFESTVNALNRATPVIEFDLNGCVITANDHFLELMGYDTIDEIQGHHHRLFCHPEFYTSPQYEEFWASLRRGEFAKGEYLRIGKGGKECWIQATYNPILDADGIPYKVKKFATDLSERKMMEEELRIAIDKAEAAVAARGHFMANMSHEIRTPMNAIIGFTEVLLDSKLDKEQRHQLQVVRNASRSLLRLLNEILDISKLEKGAVELEVTDFNFKDLCEQIIASLKVNAEQKNIKLVLDIDQHVPQYLKGDSLRIQQVLLNLLSNAIKFTEQGSVTLRIRHHDGQLRFDVIDTGIGIDKAYLKRIFDPFTQAEASTTRRFGGTGLGTAISQQLVTLMKGKIEVESELNVGTTFHIELPVPEGSPVKEKKTFDCTLPPMYVLAVDDTPNNLELIKLTMTKAGHKIDLANDGQEAIDACKKKRYDLILMDMQMPKVDGLEATRQIREYEKTNKLALVPTIAFSASVLEKDRQDALAAGMQGFAAKPLDPPALFAEISRVLGTETEDTTQQSGKSSSKKPDTQEQENREKDEQARQQTDKQDILNPGGINWKAGLRLWGNEKTLIHSIENLLQDNVDTLHTLEELCKAKQFERLAAQAHKLCGAAGNLSLYRIHKLTKDMETAAREKDENALTAAISALDKAFQAVSLEIEEKRQKAPSTPEKTANVPATLNAKQLDQAQTELKALSTGLQKGEIPEKSLKTLATLLPEQALSPLQKATNEFKFEKALECIPVLEKLLHQQTPK